MEFSTGRYRARIARSAGDTERALELRGLSFRGGHSNDSDPFDARCQHVLVEGADGALVCCFRLLPFPDSRAIAQSYSGQFYGLTRLTGFDGPSVEMGRFCIAPGQADPDILRTAWGAMARYVDDHGVKLLFGCSSFPGTQAEAYMDAFALLKDHHLAPSRWLPQVKAPAVFRFAQRLRGRVPDPKRALKAMPPLLRSYLAMGGWVSDHAVVDRDLGTLHVFTAIEISAIPPSRARLMRAAAIS